MIKLLAVLLLMMTGGTPYIAHHPSTHCGSAACNKQLLIQMVEHKWRSQEQVQCSLEIIGHEDPSWRVDALDPLSDAGGIPQANPYWNMAVAGKHYWPAPGIPTWKVAQTQIHYFIEYTDGNPYTAHYATPCDGQEHELGFGWY
jgi:hypothetical protein